MTLICNICETFELKGNLEMDSISMNWREQVSICCVVQSPSKLAVLINTAEMLQREHIIHYKVLGTQQLPFECLFLSPKWDYKADEAAVSMEQTSDAAHSLFLYGGTDDRRPINVFSLKELRMWFPFFEIDYSQKLY